MEELKSFRNQAGVVGFCRSLYVGSVLVLNIGLARAMGPELFGSFQQVFIFNALFLILTLGIPDTLYYFLPRLSEEDRPRFLGQTIMTLSITAVVSLAVFWLMAPILARYQHNPHIVRDLRMFGIYGAFLIASSFTDPVYITFKRIRFLFVLNILHAVFLLGLTVWYYFDSRAEQALFSSMAAFGAFKYLLAIFFLFRMRKLTGGIWFFQGKSTLVLQLSFALPIMLSSMIDIIARWMDKYVVSFFFGAESLGVFYVGAIEIPFIGVIISSIYSVVSPVLNTQHHRGDLADFARLVSKTLKFTTKLIWPVFIYFFFFADHIIPLVFGEEFSDAVTPFRIYLTMLPLRVAAYGVIVIALGRSRAVLQCAFLALVANAVLNIVLALEIGFIGPAIATVISTYIHVAMLMKIILSELDVGIGEIIPFRHLSTVASIGVLSGLAAFSLTLVLSDDLEVTAISLVIFVFSYLFLGSKAGLIRISDFYDIAGGNGGSESGL